MRTLNLPIILEDEKGNLLRGQECWREYKIEDISDDFGLAQAHSIGDEEARDGYVWAQITRVGIDGYRVSTKSVLEYVEWRASNDSAIRDAKIAQRIKDDEDRKAAYEQATKARKAAEKKLKDLGITKDELKAILFS